jgi:hypothetical protein
MAKPVALTADDLTTTPARRPAAATRQRAAVPSADLVPMQFRMPPDFAMQFKLAAVKRNMKYNELLEVCFQQFMKSEGEA